MTQAFDDTEVDAFRREHLRHQILAAFGYVLINLLRGTGLAV